MRYSIVAGFVALAVVPMSARAQQQIGPSQTNPLDTSAGTIPGTSIPVGGVQTNPVPVAPSQPIVAPTVPVNPNTPVSTQIVLPGTQSPTQREVAPAAIAETIPEPLRAHAGGLTADRAVARALQLSGPSLQIAQANIDIARASAAEAARNMLPQLSTSFRYTRLSDYVQGTIRIPGFAPASIAPVILDQFGWRTTLTVPLTDIPLRIYPQYQAANLQAEGAELNFEATRAQAGLEARQAYYEYVRAVGQEYLVNQSITSVQRRLDDVIRAVQAGTVARATQLQLEAQLADLQRSAVLGHSVVTLNETILRQRLHLGADEPIVLGESLDSIPALPPRLSELIDRAYQLRPEIQALDRQIEAIDRQIFATRASQFPSVAASANLDYANPNTRFFPQSQTWQATWDATVQVSWNATTVFIADATISRLRAQQALLGGQQNQLRESVELQVRQFYTAAQNALALVQSTRSALASAIENYRVAGERVAAGAAVAADLRAAETDLLRARLNAINAVIDARLAIAQIRRATGEREVADLHTNP